MKVPLSLGPTHIGHAREPMCRVKGCVPFYRSKAGNRSHRVRRANLRQRPPWSPSTAPSHRLSVQLWCGQAGSWPVHGTISEEPIEGMPVCGKCEALAVAAGEPRSVQLVSTDRALTLEFVQPKPRGT